LAPLLTPADFPARFITDTSRNGVRPMEQNAWGDWCTVIGAGFGVHPTANTGDTHGNAVPGVFCPAVNECETVVLNYRM
jgi:cellulase/cellobiase CelA1